MTTFYRNDNFHVVSRIDDLGNEWKYTYDDSGNQLTSESPLHDPPNYHHQQVKTYGSYNNVLTSTDAAGNVSTFHYDATGFPTLLTSIDEPADGQGSPIATTVMEYYLPGDPDYDATKHALLKRVTDANGVITVFDYDEWGQLARYAEGEVNSEAIYEATFKNDSASRTFEGEYGCSELRATGGGFEAGHNLNNYNTSTSCVASRGTPQQSCVPVPTNFPELPTDTPSLPNVYAESQSDYTGFGHRKRLDIDLHANDGSGSYVTYSRITTQSYNELNLEVHRSIDTTEESALPRDFAYTHDIANGSVGIDGPDGTSSSIFKDAAGRLDQNARSDGSNVHLSYISEYYDNDLLEHAALGNYADIWYGYDDAGRLLTIDHTDASGASQLLLTYTYDQRDLPIEILETSTFFPDDVRTSFTYDDRGRLIHETRTVDSPQPVGVYDLEYTYDQGGNRTRRIDHLNDLEIQYTYDINDVSKFGSANNRLMHADRHEPIGGPIVERTFYFYNAFGNITRIVSNIVGTDDYTSTWLTYAKNGATVTYILGETWNGDGVQGNAPTAYTITFGREYRYDGARQRYFNRELDVAFLNLNPPQLITATETFSDYDGDTLFGDYRTSGPTTTEVAGYHPGVGQFDPVADESEYHHTDRIGTTRILSDDAGNMIESTVFTAFGEPVSGPGHRLGYVGKHGYQSLTENGAAPTAGALPLLHLGHRYYDPTSGRFLQRDPSGLADGSNIYVYLRNGPLKYRSYRKRVRRLGAYWILDTGSWHRPGSSR